MKAFTKSRKKIALLLALLMISAPILSMPVRTFAAVATSYYVDGTIGSDANNGLTSGAAFKTIQAAANVAQSGDSVLVRAGVYREMVSPNSGVTIKNYNGENVMVSGGDLITGWALDTTLANSSNIYVADMNWDMYGGAGNIVFANGVLMKEATWPNIAVSELLNPAKYAVVDSTTTGGTPAVPISMTDAALGSAGFPVNTLTGGMLWVRAGNGYASYTAAITGQPATNKINITWPITTSGYFPAANSSLYYITRNKAVLDVATEWYKDVANGKLYFIAPGNLDPNTMEVEARKRSYAFDLNGKSNVTIDGIKIIAANINFDNSSNNIVKNAVVEAVDYNEPVGLNINDGYTLGLKLNGHHNTIRDSEIRNMYGPGILVDGHDNNVINNYIHDINFMHNYADAVKLYGYNHLVSHNTLTRAARGLVGGFFSRSVIQYNDISHGVKLSKDGATVYIVDVDMENTEIHHNVIHDVGGTLNSGLYLDNSVHNAVVYKNIVYNSSRSYQANIPDEYVLWYNNTGTGEVSRYVNADRDVSDSIGSKFINNVVKGAFSGAEGNSDMYKTRNIINADPLWTDATNNPPDLSLKSASSGYHKGMVLPGITDGFVGNLPDMGAVETGDTWKAGHDFANSPAPTFYLNPNIPYKNQMKNPGFERANFEEWTKTGSPSIFNQSGWDYKKSGLVRFNKYAAMLKAGDAIEQTLTGLKPNTTYALTAWGEIQGKVIQAESYSDMNGTFNTGVYRSEGHVSGNTAGAWVKYNEIDFGTTTPLFDSINFGAANRVNGGTITVKIDDPDTGPVIGTYAISAANVPSSAAGGWFYNNAETAINSVTGTHDVYLVFSQANSIFLENFKLSHSTNADDAILGVKDFGGTEVTTNITENNFNSTTRAKIIEFTTGPTDTSATIYASKPDGNYYAYLDGFGVAEKIAVAAPFSGSYDGNLANFTWPAITGAVSYDVYRSTLQYGPYTTIVCSEVTTTSCSDSTITEQGMTYYYTMKSRSANGVLSADSTEVTIYVPYKTSTAPYQSMQQFDSFETGLDNWALLPGKGSPTLSTASSHSGSRSYIINEDMDAIQQIFNISYNKIVTMWFYDNASATNMQVAGFVDDNVTVRAIEVNTPTSTTKYAIRLGGTHSATTVTRTTGWHEFKWDYTSGTKVDMYIDGNLVASPTGVTSFKRIIVGDQWSGNTNISYFDDIRIKDANVKPVAVSSEWSTPQDRVLSGALTASDANGDQLTYSIVSNGSKGTVVIKDPLTGTFTYTPNPGEIGTDTFTFGVNDGVENSEVSTVTVHILETTPPVTIDDGQGGWHRDAQTIHLTATDEGSGVAQTFYSINGSPFVEGNTIQIDQNGVNELRYYSVDVAGNQEAQKSVTISIDKTGPIITSSVSMSVYMTDTIHLDFQTTDDFSGVNVITIKLDGKPVAEPYVIEPLTLSLGEHIVTVTATDNVNNMSERQFVLNVQMNIDLLDEALQFAKQKGLIKNEGIYNGLMSLVKVIQEALKENINHALNALENLILAQRGKFIDETTAVKLIEWIAALKM